MIKKVRKQKEEGTGFSVTAGQKKKKGITRWQFRRIVAATCWLIFLAGFIWSVYRNFTVINTVTVEKSETVELKNEDTSGLESFVRNFAVAYFSYSPEDALQTQRNEMLYSYLPEETVGLLPVNAAETPVTVSGVQIWSIVTGESELEHKVKFTVTRKAGENPSYTSAYCADVYGKAGDYVITGLPSITSMPKKADYKAEETIQAELTDIGIKEKAEEFLNTFFKVYPASTEEELKYYLKDERIDKIERDLTLFGVDSIVITEQKGDMLKARCMVTYMDNSSGLYEASQYLLTMEAQEDGKFIITAME